MADNDPDDETPLSLRALRGVVATLQTGDFEQLAAWFSDEFVAHARFRVSTADYCRAEYLELLESHFRNKATQSELVEVLETRGDRLVLTRSNFFVTGSDREDFGDIELQSHTVVEVDERRRRCALWPFDVDDLDRALETLDARDAILQQVDG